MSSETCKVRFVLNNSLSTCEDYSPGNSSSAESCKMRTSREFFFFFLPCPVK